jgi:hypothetical protein
MNTNATQFAAHDTVSVYAVGDTPAQAIANARNAARDPDAQFDTAQITAELAAWIDAHGWNGHAESFAVRDGWLTRTTVGTEDAE